MRVFIPKIIGLQKKILYKKLGIFIFAVGHYTGASFCELLMWKRRYSSKH